MPEKQYFTGIDVINAPRIESLTVTEDGIYTPSSGVIGYNPVVVNTNQPWEPLQDGYSNFWFELTNDTLSPWLNFSAKNADATIDWGDGSGEVALDTLTPTHTYSKAGRYVVKVKGVTGIGEQQSAPYDDYSRILKNVELNSDVTTISGNGFRYCTKLENATWSNSLVNMGAQAFRYCINLGKIKFNSSISAIDIATCIYCVILHDVEIAEGITSVGNSTFNSCLSLVKITFPSTITSFGNTVLANTSSLSEVHMKPTVPPTIGTNTFQGSSSNYVIYVPVGTGDTYKAASGWSTYADHILEEGQTPNRMMLAKFNSDNTDNEEMR